MVSIDAFRKLALSLPQAEEKSHFDLPSFRVKNKIFATIHEKTNRAMIKLSAVNQSVFCGIDKTIIYSVPGYWGSGGATFFELSKVKKDVLKDALTQAWLHIAPKKLVEEYKLHKP
jgi:hypothetical protein